MEGKNEIELLFGFQKCNWNNGYATEASMAILTYSRDTYKIYRFISLIEPGNVGSEKVAQKFGMKVEKNTESWGRLYKLYAIGKYIKV